MVAALPASGSVMQIAGLSPASTKGAAVAFLRLGAVGHDGADAAHVGLDDDARGERAGAGDGLDHLQDVRVGGALAAILGRDGHAHDAGVDQIPDIVPAIDALAVPVGGALGEDGGQVAGGG